MSVARALQRLKDQTSVAKIYQHLKTRRNSAKRNYGGAYITWGTAPLSSRPSQSLSFPLEVPNLDSSKHPLSLVESTFCLLAPHEGKYRGKAWIVRAEEVDPTTWRILNPLSRIDNLLNSSSPIMAHIDNPSDFLVNEVARSYTLVDNHIQGDTEIRAPKVIPLLDPLQRELVNKENLKLLAIDWDGKLSFWKHGDEHWTNILPQYSKDGFSFTDIVSFKGKFYAISRSKDNINNKVYEIDPTNPLVDIKCVASFEGVFNCFDPIFKLAEFNGRLHIFKEYDMSTMFVFVLNKCSRQGDTHHEEGVQSNGYSLFKVNELVKWNNYILFKVNECVKSNGYSLFKINEASFSIPTHLLGRRFDQDLICVSTCHGYNMSPNGFDGCSGGFSSSYEGETWPYHGLKPIDEIDYPDFLGQFYECDLEGNLTALEDMYVSLFFPPPPWLDWHCLDADKGNPSIWFTDPLPKYEHLCKFDDIY